MKISVFGEGPTEKTVYSRIVKLLNLERDSEYISAEGKNNLNTKVIKTLGASLGIRSVRCIIMRDLDDGENESRICQGITDAFQRDLNKRDIQDITLNLDPHPIYPNVYTLHQPDLDFRLSVHIATYRWKSSFVNSTIDDYLLELALRSTTLTKLSNELGITQNKLLDKITDEIPDLLQRNGISLSEAKNYLQLYGATTKFSSLTGFVSKVMNNSDETEIREIFQPLIAAFEFVRGE